MARVCHGVLRLDKGMVKLSTPFQSALEHFRAVVHFRGGELEAKYTQLSAELERSEARAHTVHQHIAAVEDVAEALFKEWEAELTQYTNETLRRASARQLAQTRQRYTPLMRTRALNTGGSP